MARLVVAFAILIVVPTGNLVFAQSSPSPMPPTTSAVHTANVSASHRVRIRIHKHWQFSNAGARILTDSAGTAIRTVNAVRLFANSTNARVSTSQLGSSISHLVLQSEDDALFASSRSRSDVAFANDPNGRLFLLDKNPLEPSVHVRYVTVTE